MGAPPGPRQGIEQRAGLSTRARSRLGNRTATASTSRTARRPRRSGRRRGDGVGRDQGGHAAAGELLHELHHLHTSPSSPSSSQARGYAASWIGLVFVVWCHRARARGWIGWIQLHRVPIVLVPPGWIGWTGLPPCSCSSRESRVVLSVLVRLCAHQVFDEILQRR